MERFIANFLVHSLTPRSLIRLGELLIEAGKAAEARLKVVETALQSVRESVSTLTAK